MKHAVVTVFGGSGFIGRYVVQRLAKTGARVNVAVRHPERARFLKPMGHVGQVTPFFCSIADPESVARAVQGADAVVNLVGILAPGGHHAGFDDIHAEGARLVAEAAKAAGVKAMVQVSALGANAESESAYARSKAAGEEAVRAAFPEATILRPSIVFGPEDSFFNRFAAMSALTPALPLIGGGHTKFQPVYVGDVADAVMIALAKPECQGQTYELGGPTTYSFKQLLELMMSETGRKRLLVPIPFGLAEIKGAILGMLPKPLLTRDQVLLLKQDNVVSGALPGLAELGIAPTTVEVILPTYMDRFRIGGRYSQIAR
ncbi:complex I NDUFA9 subunit family protein [Oceanibaculum pacificum]|uniref:3-beta hydroxysteroid dehydrogenase n=1 Tax=Oceanibaculum pacificum TaxID=580166 RepID=A0A154WC00_9PROT|nr:complex I NDUFA9 subunit family protein [Oceanibaculum pacificum]KZD11020.1 3-beta hydroxysteroid dehydrogenase [Oceanibaculum pacificum]